MLSAAIDASSLAAVGVDGAHAANREPRRIEAAEDAHHRRHGVAVDDERAEMPPSVEPVVGERDAAQVARRNRAARTPRPAEVAGRDTSDGGAERGRRRSAGRTAGTEGERAADGDRREEAGHGRRSVLCAA